MPDYDDSFIINCAEAERRRLISYTLDRRYIKWRPPKYSRVVVKNVINRKYSGAFSPSTPNTSGSATSCQKNSLKGTKLARRARSFKDDLFEKITQMRTPTNTLGRSHSPHSPRNKHPKVHIHENVKPSVGSLEIHTKDIRNALIHFRDVISKRKLEVLPGNGTIILELIVGLFTAIQGYTLNENSSILISARTQVYMALGKLIKLCDEVLLWEDEEECTSLNNENIKEIVEMVDSAIQNLVNLAKEKLKEKESALDISGNMDNVSSNCLLRPTVDVAGQRTSLPDIPLTPRERDILEKSLSNPMRVSHSSESILRDSSPPPKPPLPNRSSNPPPLPPKRRTQLNESINPDFSFNPDHSSSLFSKSPDDNSSLLSESAGSIDSALNQSREEEEIRTLPIDDDGDKMSAMKSHATKKDFDKDIPSEKGFLRNNRHSNESGFASSQSIRTSSQSISTKRSSEQSQKSSIASNNDLVLKLETFNIGEDMFDHRNCNLADIHLKHEQNDQTSILYYSSSSISSNNTSVSLKEQNSFKTSVSSNSTETVINTTVDTSLLDDLLPPELPIKTKSYNYNNFEETDHFTDTRAELATELRPQLPYKTKHHSLMELPPPLPIKKKQKHIIAYMEICSSSTRSTEQLRHSLHTSILSHSPEHFVTSRNISHSQTMNLSQIRETMPSSLDEKPPALPPKRNKLANSKHPPTIITTPPPSPKLFFDGYENRRIITSSQCSDMSTVNEESLELADIMRASKGLPSEISATNRSVYGFNNVIEDDEGIEVVLRNNGYNTKDCSPADTPIKEETAPSILEQIDISQFLVYKKEGEDGPDIKGGYVDALIVHASRENVFGEAFITTFRTFCQPLEIVEKLTLRYSIFCCHVTDQKQKAAKESFSLLVRVVDDLTSTDLSSRLLTLLVEFVHQLLCSGQLLMAKALHNKFVEKVTAYKEMKNSSFNKNEQRNIIIHQPTLLNLKSQDIAEQMTLLDAELFQKIEIPEVLLFVQEQCEEKSPNLNKFTEHFNKMSYWARSQILVRQEAKEREKYVTKFLKIMTYLRKMNNYNSFLALLSALDSAPIRRLEWNKKVTEPLNEYCALIDSSSSFRVYRQALAETNPPCIPYIGLVLQDLTFVHVGNPPYLKDGGINFSKRWQQYNIIVNMKRFKKCDYPFRRNEEIIRFFENFENSLDEEQMWQISENIKPRGRKLPQN